MLQTLFYFFLALLLLVTFHEYGHFLVARLCGVKVLRFSFGFGKVLARWHDKQGTEYVWSLLPLGGYVKMLDETEGEVLEHERHLAFNNKPIWMRIAIVLAGPLFNLFFAFVAFWLVLVIGFKSLAPIIETVRPASIAAVAGLTAKQEIIALDGKKITSWRDFQYAIMPHIGSDNSLTLTVKSLIDGQKKTVVLPLSDWQLDTKNPDLVASLGITPFIPVIPPIVGEVLDDSPAKLAGLQINDEILLLNNQPIHDWLDLVDFVKKNPAKQITLTLMRNKQEKNISLLIGRVKERNPTQGFIGVRSQQVNWPVNWLRLQREAPFSAINMAFKQTMELTGATFSLIGRLVMGKLDLHTLSGPVGIAQGAGESARSGLVDYLSFLALVSISLGVLNLLPIPMLDGGHLLYYLIEIIRRRPLSEAVKSMGVYLGLVILIAIMMIALTNDITRLTR